MFDQGTQNKKCYDADCPFSDTKTSDLCKIFVKVLQPRHYNDTVGMLVAARGTIHGKLHCVALNIREIHTNGPIRLM